MTMYLGKDRKCDFFLHSYTCSCDRTCRKDWTRGTQFVHGQFHFISSIIWWFTY
jgi:hypothetical protein